MAIKRYNIDQSWSDNNPEEEELNSSFFSGCWCKSSDVTELEKVTDDLEIQLSDCSILQDTGEQIIKELKAEVRALTHHRKLLAINFIDNAEDGLNPLLFTQVIKDCKKLIGRE